MHAFGVESLKCLMDSDCSSIPNAVCDVRPPIPTSTCLQAFGGSCKNKMDCTNNLECSDFDGNGKRTCGCLVIILLYLLIYSFQSKRPNLPRVTSLRPPGLSEVIRGYLLYQEVTYFTL